MERLLYALAATGVTLACSPVPAPPATGKGNGTAHVTLISDAEFDQNKIQEYMGYWDDTKIEEYSRSLGELDELKWANVTGHFAYNFTLGNADCEKVNLWLEQIVPSSQHYIAALTECINSTSTAQPPSGRETEEETGKTATK
ncbi:hypothetical protein COOONC_06907 [Cooperia oncophora]